MAEREHAAATALVRRFVEGLRDALRAEHQRQEAEAVGRVAALETETSLRDTALRATDTDTALRATDTDTALRATDTDTALRETETDTDTALRATDTDTALRETETETSLRDTALRDTETETETSLRYSAAKAAASLRDADADADSDADAIHAMALAPFVFDETAYVTLPPLEVVRQWYASGFVARLRRDLDALCRATLREETELLAELARGCLSAAEDEARARAASEGEGS